MNEGVPYIADRTRRVVAGLRCSSPSARLGNTEEGQDIAGKNFYRPISEKAQAKYLKQLPKLNLFTIEQAFGGWAKADKDHFADGGSFDQIYLKQ